MYCFGIYFSLDDSDVFQFRHDWVFESKIIVFFVFLLRSDTKTLRNKIQCLGLDFTQELNCQ